MLLGFLMLLSQSCDRNIDKLLNSLLRNERCIVAQKRWRLEEAKSSRWTKELLGYCSDLSARTSSCNVKLGFKVGKLGIKMGKLQLSLIVMLVSIV